MSHSGTVDSTGSEKLLVKNFYELPEVLVVLEHVVLLT
jgi:hypothetical protein